MIQVPMSKKVTEVAEAERAGDESADDRAGDADEHRDDDAAWVVAGQDHLRDGADEEAEDDPSDDSHLVLRSWQSPSQRRTRVD